MKRTVIALATVMGLMGVACGGSEPVKTGAAPEAEIDDQELTILARDFGYDLLGGVELEAGEIRLTLENLGEQSHEAQLYLLNDGVTYEDFAKVAAKKGETTDLPPAAAAMVTPGRGVTSNVDPGDTITVPTPVEPGTYAFVCHLLDPSSLNPHFSLGMMAPLEIG
jgi:hypothetical protein